VAKRAQLDVYAQVERLIRQRPGIDPRNYSDVTSYLQDCRRAASLRSPALRLLEKARASISPEQAQAHLTTYAGRLAWTPRGVEVLTGQYYPVEYRRHLYDWLRALVAKG